MLKDWIAKNTKKWQWKHFLKLNWSRFSCCLDRKLQKFVKLFTIFWSVIVGNLDWIFRNLDWIRRGTLYLSAFSSNTARYQPEKLCYFPIFLEHFARATTYVFLITINLERLLSTKWISFLWEQAFSSYLRVSIGSE